MPNLRIDLQDRRVVISVLVLLAAILVLNWRVFQPLRKKIMRDPAAKEEAMQLPGDLTEVTGFAAAQLAQSGSGGGLLDITGPDSKAAARDPFLKMKSNGKTHVTRYGRKYPKLVCSAVLLGGAQPAALINGKSYRPGSLVHAERNYVVEKISNDGVTLTDGHKKIFLPVGPRNNKSKRYPLITETQKQDAEGHTKIEKIKEQ